MPAPPRFHWLRIRATSHGTEVIERVEQAVRTIAGLDEETAAPMFERTVIASHHGGNVTHLELCVQKNRLIRDFVERLARDPTLRRAASAGISDRVDEDGTFYLRFSKQDAFQGRLVPATGDDTIQVRLRIEVHPASQQAAIEALSVLFAPS